MRPLLANASRLLFIFAAAGATLASLVVLFTAGATQVSASNGGPQTVTQLSWLESQGWWGLAILLIFSALYSAPAYFFAGNRRGMAVLFSAAAVILTILASFTIGIFYYIPALALLLALATIPFSHK